MSEQVRPRWLAAAEHGALGEARAKALLLERFWVLERSVDVQGADFLIQRRLLDSHPLSADPPRFGLVQVKFVQDGKTPIRIPAAYVQDDKGLAYDEFFLLVFTGSAGTDRTFLLSGSEVASKFKAGGDPSRPSFEMMAHGLLDSEVFEVRDRGRALDKIEHVLQVADFIRNRRYMSRTYSSYVAIDPTHIHDDYQISIDNWYGDIPSGFYDMKHRIRDLLIDVDDVAEALRSFLTSIDPLDGWDLLETRVMNHVDGRNQLSFNFRQVVDDDLLIVVRQHRRRLDRIRKLGLEARYLALFAAMQGFVAEDLARHLPLTPTTRYILTLRLDVATLNFGDIRARIETAPATPNDELSRATIQAIGDGVVEISYEPYRWFIKADLEDLQSGDPIRAARALRSTSSRTTEYLVEWLDDKLDVSES